MLNEQIRAVRAAIKESSSRPLLQIYAFLRGRALERMEPRVSEHNLPSIYVVRMAWKRLFPDTPAPAEIEGWLRVPEARIKRFGPRVPRLRPSRGVAAALVGAAIAVSSQTSSGDDGGAPCRQALAEASPARIASACDVPGAVATLLGAQE